MVAILPALQTVLSTRDANYGIGRTIAPDTFVIDQVERKGHLHCYCDATTLVALLAGFDLRTLSQQLQERRPSSHHWHIIAETSRLEAVSEKTPLSGGAGMTAEKNRR